MIFSHFERFNENHRKSMKINEKQRKSTKIDENRRKSTKINENQQKFAQKSKFRKIRRRLSHSMRNNLTKKDMRAI